MIDSHGDKAKFTLQHEYFWRLNGYVHGDEMMNINELRPQDGGWTGGIG